MCTWVLSGRGTAIPSSAQETPPSGIPHDSSPPLLSTYSAPSQTNLGTPSPGTTQHLVGTCVKKFLENKKWRK